MTRFAALIFAPIFFLASFFFTSQSHATVVKVRLTSALSEISVQGMNLRLRTKEDSFSGFGSGRGIITPLNSFTIKPELAGGGIRWSVTDKLTGRKVRDVNGSILTIDGQMIRMGMKPVPNTLVLRASFVADRPRIDVVAALDIEDYLKGVLPHEMPPEWPADALRAQAVASRTYVLEKIKERNRQNKFYHVESTVMDQVYNWLIPTKEESTRAAAVRKALEETKSVVLANASGKLVPAYFHADCGGKTEEASEVWGSQEAKSGTATDAYCPFSPKAKWSWNLSSAEIYAKIRTALKLPWEGDLKEITVSELTASGRVAKLAIVTREGVRHFISGAQFRSLVGFDRLRSTAFTLVRQPSGQYKFDGRGYGHGVGLCQWGARKLANLGTNYKDILKHYYPTAVLSTVE